MLRVTILYPRTAESRFDMDYYLEKHIPLVARLLGDNLERYEVDEGLGGALPGDPPPFAALGHFYFASTDALKAMGKTGPEMTADLSNFTDVQPLVQVSKIRE